MGWLSSLLALLAPAPPVDMAARRAIARTVELVDPRLADTHGLERVLAGPVTFALGYCEGLVDALPGPLEIERRAFASDPLVHALFATGNSIDEMLGKSQAVRDFLDEAASYAESHFYALFAARRMEKKQLGSTMLGETIQHDVPQTVLYFADHTLAEPAPTLDAARERLRSASFDSLLKTFRAHLDELRVEREGVRADLSVERGLLTLLRGKEGGGDALVRTRRVAALDARLRQIGDALTPATVLSELARFLAAPEVSLRLQPCSVTVDRMGVVAPEGDGIAGDVARLEFPELISRDRRRYLVTLARVDCEEARCAVREALDARRRYVVI